MNLKVLYSPVTNLFSNNRHSIVKDISLKLDRKKIKPNEEFEGAISVSYPGRYDGVVVNTQILDSNELVVYKSSNGKKISQNVSRLFISRDSMPENQATFSAAIEFEPKKQYEVKFRASVIEQHKEIESDVVFAEFSA